MPMRHFPKYMYTREHFGVNCLVKRDDVSLATMFPNSIIKKFGDARLKFLFSEILVFMGHVFHKIFSTV